MSLQEIALCLVIISFGLLVVHVYRPTNKQKFEHHGRIPLDQPEKHL
jgi:cbb3-type cytochrome oxidase subunit 3